MMKPTRPDVMYLQYILVLTITFMVTFFISPTQGLTNSQEIVDLVSHSYWSWKMRQFPTIAMIYKFRVPSTKLESYSLKAVDEHHEYARNLLEHLKPVNVSELDDERWVTYDVLRADLDHYIDGYKYRHYGYLNPISFLEAVHKRTSWINYQPLDTERDCNEYLLRLQAVGKQFDEVTELLRLAVKLNRTNHRVSMTDVLDSLDLQVELPVNETDYYKPFTRRSLVLPHTYWASFVRKGTAIIETIIQPALLRMRDYLSDVYLNNTRVSVGVGSLEGGTEYYQACLRFHLTDDVTAEQVRDLGLSEVARIRTLLEKIMRREGFEGELSEFYKHLRTERRREFYNRTQDELLERYRHLINNVINPKLQYIVKEVPDEPINVSPMPFDGPTGSYGGNTFYVNLRRPDTRPSFTMMALALHESNPGHHLQGWGLYSEYLGEEMGCYNESALELFGRYSFEIFRACRLVVDTGLHVFGWTQQQAVDYIANHTAISRSQVEKEVNRYITWPGQACAYKYGELALLRLRKEAEETLGAAFDIREFHHQVLKVSRVPLKVLEKHIYRWMDKAKAEQITSGSPATSLYPLLCIISALVWTINSLYVPAH